MFLWSKLFGRKQGAGPRPAGTQRVVIETPTPGAKLPPGSVDYRPQEEKEIEQQALRGVSKGPEIDALVEELIQIGKTTKFYGKNPGPDFNQSYDIRAREIGNILNVKGGMSLMQFACYRVGVVVGKREMSQLEGAWHNIGDWRA